jgi:hypothetical protein
MMSTSRYHSHLPFRGVTLAADQGRLRVLTAVEVGVSAAVLVVEVVVLNVITQPTQARARIGVLITILQHILVAHAAEVVK